jgi:hypothetical protein
MTEPHRHRAKCHRKVTRKPKGALSPEVLESIGKILPGIIRAVAVLIEAISRLR